MAERQRRSRGGTRGGQKAAQKKGGQKSGQRRAKDNQGIIPVLAKGAREVEGRVQRGQVTSSERARFQAIALLSREERARVRADAESTDAQRDGQLKRLDGIATILAQTAAREPSLFHLLDPDAVVSDGTRSIKREMERAERRRR